MSDFVNNIITNLLVNDKQASQALDDYTQEAKKAEAQTKETTKATIEYNSALDGMVDGLDVIPAGLSNTLKGLNGLTKGFKGLRLAIIATGLGALIIALGALYTWFNRTREGQERLAVGMAGLGAVVDVLLDAFADLGEGIYNAFNDPKQAIDDLWEYMKTNLIDRVKTIPKLFTSIGKIIEDSLDFNWDGAKEGMEDFANQLVFISTGIDVGKGLDVINEKIAEGVEESKKAMEIQELRNELSRQQIAWLTQEVKIENEISELRLITNDRENNTLEVRKKAASDLDVATAKLFAGRKALLQLEVSITKQQQALSHNRTEDYQELAQLQRELLLLDKAENDMARELLEKKIAIKQEEIAIEEIKRKAFEADVTARNKRDEAALASLNKLYDEEETLNAMKIEDAKVREATLLQIELDRYNASLENKELTDNERLLLEEQYTQAVSKIKEDGLKNDAAVQAQADSDRIEKNQFMHDAIRNAARTDTKLGKALAIADVMINTSKGIMQTVGTLGMPLSLPFIALIVKQSADSITDILSVPIAGLGMLIQGNSHAQGGVLINAEGGEGVINKRSMADPTLRRMASDINVAGGGVPFMARGGIVGGSKNQVSLLGLEDEFARALQKVPPVLVTEDLHSTLNRINVTSKLSTL